MTVYADAVRTRDEAQDRWDVEWIEGDVPELPVPWTVFSSRNLSPEHCRVVQVMGDAMSPELRNGDLAMIDTRQTRPVDGEIYAVLVEDQVVLRRLYRHVGGLEMRGTDPGLPAWRFDNADIAGQVAQVLGKVVYRAG